MQIADHFRFIRRYVRAPHVVGAVTPSSRVLAEALCRYYRDDPKPATVLEVGAGTGSITRYLGTILGDADSLDICELQPSFVKILRRNVVSNKTFAPAMRAGRVQVIGKPVQALSGTNRYDYVISGLPFTVFDIEDVREIFGVIRRVLKPGGVLSYFEYVAMRKVWRSCTLGRTRNRMRQVCAFLNQQIHAHQFDHETVLKNLPPAHARHLRFES